MTTQAPGAGRLVPTDLATRTATARRLAAGGVAAIVASGAMGILLHVLPASSVLDPLSSTLSEYALTPIGWLFDLAVVTLSAGSAAILASLLLRGLVRARSMATIMMIIWCLGLIGLVVFHKQHIGTDLSFIARVHWTWTLIAFFSLPIGAALTVWRHRELGSCSRQPIWAVRLCWVAAGWFVVLTVETALSALTNFPWSAAVGFVERALSVTEMVTVLLLGVWTLRDCACRSASTFAR